MPNVIWLNSKTKFDKRLAMTASKPNDDKNIGSKMIYFSFEAPLSDDIFNIYQLIINRMF